LRWFIFASTGTGKAKKQPKEVNAFDKEQRKS